MNEGQIVPVRSRRRRVLLLAGLWLFVALVLVAFRSVVMFFAAAALIAYLVAPLVDRLTHLPIGKRRLPRWTAILLIYLAFFTAVYLAFIALVPQLYREMARISRDAVAWSNTLTPERIREISRDLEDWLTARGLPVEISSRALEGAAGEEPPGSERPQFSLSVDLERVLQKTIARVGTFARDNFGDIVGVSRRVVTGVLAGIFALFFILMVAAFFSIDTQTIRRYVSTLIPPEYGGDVVTLAKMIDRKLAGVVRGQVTICLINGVLTFIGLLLLGVKFAFLLATLATILSLIPIFGTIVSSVPIVAIGLSQGWKTGIGALLWIVGIHALEAYFLNPKIMGTAARIHPIVIAFALIAGERTYGLVGALFAVPLAAVVVACFDFLRLKAQPPAAPETAMTSER
ncbi:MAG: AI-2E family transporter [Myxococcaceae bacterium]|nr:AI-2E family transporter [Myxococcaceae bacterium]